MSPQPQFGWLTPSAGWIFRITHLQNVPFILDHGLHCASSEVQDPNFLPIGNPDLIGKRSARPVPIPPGGTLADYVPFYFTPLSPMLYNILTGHGVEQVDRGDIVVLASKIGSIRTSGAQVVFTDRHAYLQTATYFPDEAGLQGLAWDRWQNRDFKRRTADDVEMERYQAEALVHARVPIDAVLGLACYDERGKDTLAAEIASRGLPLKVQIKPEWLFA
ncbi:MAG: DUF4433 domain-containing protein [Planctomycetes bacterium]|nr:DUF4433 domain-containing protein [Planctomycetota bacterium]